MKPFPDPHGPVYRSRVPRHTSNMIQALVAARCSSKDPNTRVGAIVVEPKTNASFVGYNGFPAGFPDLTEIWDNRDVTHDHCKYAYARHAEANAITKAYQCLGHLEGCVLYSSHYPCDRCMKDYIVMSGIKTVYYADDKHFNEKSQLIALHGDITLIKHLMPKVQLLIDGVEI